MTTHESLLRLADGYAEMRAANCLGERGRTVADVATARAALATALREAGTGERRFPLQAHGVAGPLSIPWSVADKAYAVYAAKYGRDQSLERLAERGGFGWVEMDVYYPAWRDECNEIEQLRTQLATATSGQREAEAARDEARAERDRWERDYHDVAQTCNPAGDLRSRRVAEDAIVALKNQLTASDRALAEARAQLDRLARNADGLDRVLHGARLPDATLGQDAALVAQWFGDKERALTVAQARAEQADARFADVMRLNGEMLSLLVECTRWIENADYTNGVLAPGGQDEGELAKIEFLMRLRAALSSAPEAANNPKEST